jgi:hypothetical protein
MATATKKPSSHPPALEQGEKTPAQPASPWLLWAFDATYRFLASLKLAVISLSTLAAVLAYATLFESWYGTAAAQERIYRSPWFAIILAFLFTNILCAALIRFPWTKRQTGFVITHTGLLIVLVGAFITLQYADEGKLGLVEGSRSSELVRPDYPVIRVRKLDPETGRPVSPEYVLDFRPGAFRWEPGRYEVLSSPGDPFKLAIKASYPASTPYHYICEPSDGKNGLPMIKARLFVKAPGMPEARDVLAANNAGMLAHDPHWIIARNRIGHAAVALGPARLTFQFVDSEEKVEEFLNPPQPAGPAGAVRMTYQDKAGRTRHYDWALDGQAGKSVALPESDLSVRFIETRQMGEEGGDFTQLVVGEPTLHTAVFEVREGSGPEIKHTAWAFLPQLPNVLPGHFGSKDEKELVRISYFRPALDGGFGLIEILGTPKGQLYYRVIGRDGLRGPGRPLRLDTNIPALGGGTMPMELSFRVEQYYPSGRERRICEPIETKEEGIPACLVEMTVDGHTQEFWLRRTRQLFTKDENDRYEVVDFPTGSYQIAYDCDRKDLGFSLALDNFEVRMDPGTRQPASYKSEVHLTDEASGIKDQPHTIEMNRTLTHRDWTFYQSSYDPVRDPRTGQETGQFWSIFQVGYDPGRWLKYGGGFLVLLGTFVQFYMRAGIFTDGGQRQRARAAAKARKKAERQRRHLSDNHNGQAGPSAEPEPL